MTSIDEDKWQLSRVGIDPTLWLLVLDFPALKQLALQLTHISGVDIPFLRSPGARFSGEDRQLHLDLWQPLHSNCRRIGFQFEKDQDRLVFALTVKLLRADACAAENARQLPANARPLAKAETACIKAPAKGVDS